MIRRLFWVVLGAAVGIGGYRRVSRAARMLLPNGGLVGASGTAAFVRDVRAGMAEYLDRHGDI